MVSELIERETNKKCARHDNDITHTILTHLFPSLYTYTPPRRPPAATREGGGRGDKKKEAGERPGKAAWHYHHHRSYDDGRHAHAAYPPSSPSFLPPPIHPSLLSPFSLHPSHGDLPRRGAGEREKEEVSERRRKKGKAACTHTQPIPPSSPFIHPSLPTFLPPRPPAAHMVA
jgi:hypothetical protein